MAKFPKKDISDKMEGKEKRFEKIKHNHRKPLCKRCIFDEQEAWLAAKLATLKTDTKHRMPDGSMKTIKKVRVVRGKKFNDCIGVQISWQ